MVLEPTFRVNDMVIQTINDHGSRESHGGCVTSEKCHISKSNINHLIDNHKIDGEVGKPAIVCINLKKAKSGLLLRMLSTCHLTMRSTCTDSRFK